jgi:hypothetical protein
MSAFDYLVGVATGWLCGWFTFPSLVRWVGGWRK